MDHVNGLKGKETRDEIWPLSEQDVLTHLKTSKRGLSASEVRERQKVYGRNEFVRKKASPISVLYTQFKSPLILILLITAAVAFLFESQINAVIIILIVLLSAILGFYNEYKAEKTIEDLLGKITYEAKVFRDGIEIITDVKELVPGDVVVLSGGDVVPADLRLIDAKNLEIDEAALTGEYYPIHKIFSSLSFKSPVISQLKNCAFMGTTVKHGSGIGVVFETGTRTEFGKISLDIMQERPQTDFQKGLTDFGNLLIKVTVILAVFIFIANGFLKANYLDALLFSLAIAVGLTPELLPAIVTINLSNGATRMLKKGVIVKRMVAVEDFGNMDTLCSDKTGTLTEGEITLVKHSNVNGEEDKSVLMYALMSSHTLIHKNKVSGHPIDVAITRHAISTNVSVNEIHKRVAELPFDYERRRMSMVYKIGKRNLMVVKGAPIEMLSACKNVRVDGKLIDAKRYVKKLSKEFVNLSSKGNRVIVVAVKETERKKEYSFKDERGLTMIGYLVFFDPPKHSAKTSIPLLKSLGVDLKILTGDNEYVAESISQEIGLHIKGIITGPQLVKMGPKKLKELVEKNNIFARITPEQKVLVINALRENGHIVGFLGDGINDAPSMHAADVGISVDGGVDVAKEASDIVLLKKSLTVLSEGIVEGRKIFGNTMKYVLMAISSNFGNMFSVAGASIFLPFLPMLPVQILLTNLIYDLSELTIHTDNVDEEYIKKPKRWDIKFISRFMVFFGAISSIFDFLTFGILLFLLNATPALFRTGWFIESLATEIFVIFIIRTRRPFLQSRPGTLLVATSLLALTIAVLLPFSPFASLFEFTPPSLSFLTAVGVIVIVYVALVETAKHYFYSKYAQA